MGPGTLTSISGNVITCAAGSMISKMDGSGNYSPNESGLDALIAPCGATSISFSFDKWKVKSGVNLKIYDGQDATGVALHPNNGFDDKNAPSAPIVAKSGAMYFLWNSGASTDEGFLRISGLQLLELKLLQLQASLVLIRFTTQYLTNSINTSAKCSWRSILYVGR